MANLSVEEDEDDYMNMSIAEPAIPKEKETYTQRRMRKEREAELKRPKSKAEQARLAAAAREAALSQPLHETQPSSKGLKMMQAMGFRAGDVLGKQQEGNNARSEPILVDVKEDRGGIGLDSERKRKIREEFQEDIKRTKVDEGAYRERVRLEREEKRTEGLVLAAQKVAERLDVEDEGRRATGQASKNTDANEPEADTADGLEGAVWQNVRPNSATTGGRTKPLKQINILWRGLLRHREEAERDRRMRYDLHQSLSRLPTYNDPNEDEDDKRALGKGKDDKHNILEEELEEDDTELEEFNALPPAERLAKLVQYLRLTHHYCFWCKYQYIDESMDGCPGVTEEDHD